MNHFVTLFDKNYLSRGLLLIDSLKKTYSSEYRIFILAMDDVVYDFFDSSQYEGVSTISVSDMIDAYKELEELRKERSVAEFCWTLSSYSIKYVIEHYNPEMCTYVDSDLYFYYDPKILIDKMGDKSVLITEHNYYHKYDFSELCGKFCVQFMCFKNNKDGMRVLEWWRQKCEEWCYDRNEDGKFGDQKYLDDWESRFQGIVYNCNEIGCGVAPWNCQKYNLINEKGVFYVSDKISKLISHMSFFHFHGIKRMKNDEWIFSTYIISEDFKKIYREYIKKIISIEKKLNNNNYNWNTLSDDPYKKKNKLKNAIKTSWQEFKKLYFEKPDYYNNIEKVVFHK